MLALGCGGQRERPDALLIIIDTFRADHAGFMGCERETTPSLDSLAAAGTVWTDFHAQSSWTLPAVTSIMTGLTPRQHMAGRRDGTFFGLDPQIPTLQRTFRTDGYETAAFFNVIFLNEDFGFHHDFDLFDCRGFTNRAATRGAGETVDAFLSWLDSRDGGRPFLAIVHFYDPHMPYAPPSPWDSLFTDPSYDGPFDSSWGGVTQLMAVNSGQDTIDPAGLQNLLDLYDGEIAYTDAQIGRMLEGLRQRGLGGRTVVFVTADHGEEFLEHGRVEHGNNLFEETVHVPLVASGPGIPVAVRNDGLHSQVDIMPAMLALCGLEAPGGLPGAGLLEGSTGPARVHASGVLWRDADLASGISEARKVVWDSGTGEASMFDLEADPTETDPLLPDSVLLGYTLSYWAEPAVGHPEAVAFAETVGRALRDLGYIR